MLSMPNPTSLLHIQMRVSLQSTLERMCSRCRHPARRFYIIQHTPVIYLVPSDPTLAPAGQNSRSTEDPSAKSTDSELCDAIHPAVAYPAVSHASMLAVLVRRPHVSTSAVSALERRVVGPWAPITLQHVDHSALEQQQADGSPCPLLRTPRRLPRHRCPLHHKQRCRERLRHC